MAARHWFRRFIQGSDAPRWTGHQDIKEVPSDWEPPSAALVESGEGVDWRAVGRISGHHDGCDCTELCEMGPTCPGGSLARLAGSGCWRTRDIAHELTDDCPCGPTSEPVKREDGSMGWLMVHHSLTPQVRVAAVPRRSAPKTDGGADAPNAMEPSDMRGSLAPVENAPSTPPSYIATCLRCGRGMNPGDEMCCPTLRSSDE